MRQARTTNKKIPKKNKSILGYAQTYGFEPEANRAIAREMYVDSTVNDVRRG